MNTKAFELYIKQQNILSEADIKDLLSDSVDKRDLICMLIDQEYKILQLEELLDAATQQAQNANTRYLSGCKSVGGITIHN